MIAPVFKNLKKHKMNTNNKRKLNIHYFSNSQSATTSSIICPCCEANIPKYKIKQVKIPHTNKMIIIKEKETNE